MPQGENSQFRSPVGRLDAVGVTMRTVPTEIPDLGELGPFARCSREQLARLRSLLTPSPIAAGEVVIECGAQPREFAVIAAGAGIAAWLAAGDRAAAPTYATHAVQRGDLALTVVANGSLQPTRTVAIGSELSGTVARVLVDVNDHVAKGQVLVELDTAKLRDQVALAVKYCPAMALAVED